MRRLQLQIYKYIYVFFWIQINRAEWVEFSNPTLIIINLQEVWR